MSEYEDADSGRFAIGLEMEIVSESDFDSTFDSGMDALHRHVEPARKSTRHNEMRFLRTDMAVTIELLLW
jgi:hypothetical protein